MHGQTHIKIIISVVIVRKVTCWRL